MTDLMAKDLDLAIGYAARATQPAAHVAASCARSSARRARPGTAARTSRRWPRSSGSSPARRSGARCRRSRPPSSPSISARARPRPRCGAGRGSSRSRARRSTRRIPEPGWAEQDPDGWWASVIGGVRRAAGRRHPSDVCGGGLDRVLGGARDLRAVRRRSCEPLAPGILWSDRRAADDAAALGDPGRFRATTGVVLNGAAHAAKLAWVAREMPDVLRRALDGSSSHAISSSRD